MTNRSKVIAGVLLVFSVLTAWGINSWWGQDDLTLFVKEIVKHPKQTGAFSPCTRFVAEEIVKHVQRVDGKPLRVLEVGAGLGTFTVYLAQLLQEGGDCLDVVEINPAFCEVLEKRFGDDPNVAVHCLSILDWEPAEHYDFIISAVPFYALPVSFTEDVLRKYEEMIKPAGILSYVELVLQGAKGSLLFGKSKQEFLQRQEMLTAFRDKYLFERELVCRNIPPIWVYHCRLA